jgi:hypothetical protein
MSVAVYVLFFLFLFYYFRPVLGYDIALESDAWCTHRLGQSPLNQYLILCIIVNWIREYLGVQNLEISSKRLKIIGYQKSTV